jgi:hypothetical protein
MYDRPGNKALLQADKRSEGRAEVRVEHQGAETEFLPGRMAAGISNWETASNYIRRTWT